MNYMVAKRNRVNDLDRIFDDFLNGSTISAAQRVPAVDISESAKGYVIIAELPGFSQDELEIQVKENLLTINAEKSERAEKKEDKKEDVKFLKKERASLSARRSFYLPKDASPDNIEAVLRNGLLTLSINKMEEKKPRAIKVQTK